MSAVMGKLFGTSHNMADEKIVTEEGVQEKLFVSAANAAFDEFDYGDVIGKKWLLDHFALEEPETGTKKDFDKFAFDFMQNIEGFKAYMLEEHKMHLESVRGNGYRIVMPGQQSDVAMVKLRKAVSTEMDRAITVLRNVNEQLLTDEEIRRRDEQQGKIAAMAAFSKKRIT